MRRIVLKTRQRALFSDKKEIRQVVTTCQGAIVYDEKRPSGGGGGGLGGGVPIPRPFFRGGPKIQKSGPPTRIAIERRDRAGEGSGGGGGWCPSSQCRGNFAFGAQKYVLSFSSSYKQGALAPEGWGSLPSEAVPHPREKNSEKGVGAEREKGHRDFRTLDYSDLDTFFL